MLCCVVLTDKEKRGGNYLFFIPKNGRINSAKGKKTFSLQIDPLGSHIMWLIVISKFLSHWAEKQWQKKADTHEDYMQLAFEPQLSQPNETQMSYH